MFSKILCAHVFGIDATQVDVEIDISNMGLPSFTVVGLAEGAVKESKERVRSALKNLGYNIFACPITINLAPADIKKEGTHYDLPIAIGLLSALEPDHYDLKDTLILGELSLDGGLRGVSGVLCIVAWAAENGIKRVILPKDNADEALLISNIDVYGLEHLSEVIMLLKGKSSIAKSKPSKSDEGFTKHSLDFIDVKGQYTAKRAAEVAAAGMHNFIMMGSPGSGKTMIAKRIPSILPPMLEEEALLTTKVHSVAGLLKNKGELVKARPFIAPHHTASNVAIVGGGTKVMPGHVSIATNGVLFMDELLEFNRTVLEVLRQPLEDKEVTIARAGKTITYPANFMLIAACNPCPCGYNGDPRKDCTCSPQMVERYRSRLSGPLLDRIDIHINLFGVSYQELEDRSACESSEDIRKRVINAHKIQSKRFKGRKIYFNSQMSEKDIKKYCSIDDLTKKLLNTAMDKFALSARGYNKILKTARTIADLANSDHIKSEHISEALQYRIVEK